MIYFILGFSLFFNLILVWFIYKSLYRQADLIALIEDLQYKIDLFAKHMETIYELPMYYGEPTIENLINHSRVLLSSFEIFNRDYVSFDGEREYGELQEEAKDEEWSGKRKKEKNKQHLF